MPLSFRTIMRKHEKEILSGAIHPDSYPESDHSSGYLEDAIEKRVELIPQEMHNHQKFGIVAGEFGRLAHYLADLNDPLVLMDTDSREGTYRNDFAIYAEMNIPKFPWIFDGHIDKTLEKNQIAEYLKTQAERAARNYQEIGEAYYPEGTLVSSNTFDEHSLPFGIASLSYSHSVSSTVQVWFYIWRKAHGDTSFTPFYSEKESAAKYKHH